MTTEKENVLIENYNPSTNKIEYICFELTEEELEKLKFIDNDILIFISSDACFQLDIIYKKLREGNKNNKIELDIENKEEFNKYILTSNIKYENVDIYHSLFGDSVPLNSYIFFEKILYKFVEHAQNLSPFEKYIYAYNITKKFKKYKEETNDLDESRELYDILENEYMVCVGFSNLFGDLLSKLGIKNVELGVRVNSPLEGHSRRYVYLIDEKYNINGFYISDPTWDNDLEEDYYNYMIMTDRESSSFEPYILVDEDMDLFNVENLDEFYQKINTLINKKYKFKKSTDVIASVVLTIEDLDPMFVDSLVQKYEANSVFDLLDNNSLNIIIDIGNYVVNHVNKSVSGDTIMKAVEVIYREFYGYSENMLQNVLEQVREKNKKRQAISFPTRYKKNLDGSIEIYDNEFNKFDNEGSILNKNI